MDKHDETDLFERPPEMESNDSDDEDCDTFDVPDKEEWVVWICPALSKW